MDLLPEVAKMRRSEFSLSRLVAVCLDQETQELMTLFYQKWLAGTDKHQALRESELEMRERVKQRYGEDRPRLWGALVLVGR